jgi:hypothetical protein
MDVVTVRMILTAIAENDPSRIQPGEPARVVAWLKQRVWLDPRDPGREPQHNPGMEPVWHAAEKAVASYEAGDFEAATSFALEALEPLGEFSRFRKSAVH